ncbi:MAG: hypothetical protein ACTTKT_03825 [Prevotella veroralis]|nr:hypothetical protein [uncultured Prevotella sp.]
MSAFISFRCAQASIDWMESKISKEGTLKVAHPPFKMVGSGED